MPGLLLSLDKTDLDEEKPDLIQQLIFVGSCITDMF